MDQRLHDAARTGDVDALHALRSADPLILNKVCLSHFAETPLHVAILAGHTEFAKEIIRLMPSFAKELNRDGSAPMHVASARGDVDILMELLKLDENHSLSLQRDSNGRTPLHYAVVRGRIPVIEMLTSHCVESLQEETTLGETVLHLAVKNSQFGALKVVLERLKGLECFEKLLYTKDYHGKGKTIVELAQAKRQVQVLEVLKEYQNAHIGNHDEIMEADQHPNYILPGAKTYDDKQEADEGKKKPRQIDTATLVLTGAVLIATVTYQAGLGPPSTLLKEYELNPRCTYTFIDFFMSMKSDKRETFRHCPAYYFYFFMLLNTAGFVSSVALIMFVTLRYAYTYPPSGILSFSIFLLLVNYMTCLSGLLENHSKSKSVIYATSGAIVLFHGVWVSIIFWICRPVLKLLPKMKCVIDCKSWKKDMEEKRNQWWKKMLEKSVVEKNA